MNKNTRALIDRLSKTAETQPHGSGELRGILEVIGACGDPLAATGVLPLFFGVEAAPPSVRDTLARLLAPAKPAARPTLRILPPEITDAALSAVARLLSPLPANRIAEFDLHVRTLSTVHYETSISWRFWTNGAKPNFAALPEDDRRIWLLAVLASDRDGYVRESAVRELAKADDGTELGFLLWRTTDWIEPVRDLALAAVQERLRDARYAPAFAATLPLARRLESVRRVDCSALMTAIHRSLLDEPDQSSLVGALGFAHAPIRRETCRVLDLAHPMPNARAIERVAADGDPVVRRWAMRWENRLRFDDPAAASILRIQMLGDLSPQIRADALRAIAAVDGNEAVPVLWRCLTDSSGSVRLCAHFHLREYAGSSEIADHYRQTLMQDGPPPVGAIAGIGETGTASDFDLLPSLLDGSSRYAQAAFRAMAALDTYRARPLALSALSDQRPGVRRAAINVLGGRLTDSEGSEIAALWARLANDDAATTLARATLMLPPWTALGVLLFAAGTRRDDAIDEALAQWRPSVNPLYPPSAPDAQHLRLRDTLRSLSGRLREDLIERLDAAIG